MPIYEYKCKKCGFKTEKLQKISEKPLRTCPACHKPALEKLISNTSFQLKGTGWYVTDFKNKTTSGNKEEEKAKSSGDSSSKKTVAPTGAKKSEKKDN
jgi:putative FmdB family regulatory protein